MAAGFLYSVMRVGEVLEGRQFCRVTRQRKAFCHARGILEKSCGQEHGRKS